MARPSSRWRTTRPCIVPMTMREPMAGRTVDLTAAPESERSMIRTLYWRPSSRVAPVFRQVELVPVGQPGQLRRQFFPLAVGALHRHGEAAGIAARDVALDPADMVDVEDDPLAGRGRDGRDDGNVARRHVVDPARKLGAVFQHEAAEQIDGDAAEAAALFGIHGLDRCCVLHV
jgi:hypothetical protein